MGTIGIKRRAFLGALAFGGVALRGQDQTDPETKPEPSSTPDVRPERVIDTHTHFYDPSRPEGVPWPPKNDTLLHKVTLPKDYRTLRQPLPVNGTVVVEASSWLEDNQWLLNLAKNDQWILGIVGRLDPREPEFRKQLDRFDSNPTFLGIRLGEGQLRNGLADESFINHLEALADKDLALDLLIGPGALNLVENLAQRVPKLRIVIDHLANVRVTEQAPPPAWRDGMKRLQNRENVFCKVSGLVEGTGRENGQAPKNMAFYAPYLDVAWVAFGARRLIYASNWPVCGRFADLETVQSIPLQYFERKGQEASDGVFWKNGQRAYRWKGNPSR